MLTGSRPSPDYLTEEESFDTSAKKPLLATWRHVDICRPLSRLQIVSSCLRDGELRVAKRAVPVLAGLTALLISIAFRLVLDDPAILPRLGYLAGVVPKTDEAGVSTAKQLFNRDFA